MNELESKILELVNVAEKLVDPSIDIIITATRVDGLASVFSGVTWLVLMLVLVKLARSSWVKCVESKDTLSNVTDLWGFVAFLSCFGALMSLVFVMGYLLDLWTWVAIFYPELYIAHTLIGKVL